MRRDRLLVPAFLFLLLLSGTAAALGAGSEPAPTPWPTKAWPVSEPRKQDLDPDRLGDLVARIRDGRYPDIHGLLVVRNGYMVLEEYFDGHDGDDLHTLQSVSKSFTSALVGIAIDQGKFKGVGEKVLDFFPGIEGIDNLDDRKRAMTLEDLLTMRSGTDYREGYAGSPHSTLNSMSRGWDRFILGRPMVREPGTYFQYDSGAVILTSSMLKNRTGMHADEFAKRHLFQPLGIKRYDWVANEEGHPHTGGGLDLLPRDMAKLGLLYLRGGRWEGRQIVPESWVRESTRLHVRFDPPRGRSIGYGYWWWILPPDPAGKGMQNIYAAMGFMGQYIFVVPEHDLVAVVTAGARGVDQRRPIEFLYSHILPAISSSSAPR